MSSSLPSLATGPLPPDYTYGVQGGVDYKYNGMGIINVKDYATGNGVTDDTAGVQAALDAAFGSYAIPHGASYTLNKAIYFPNGTYLVRSPATAVITGAVSGTGGVIRLTLSTTLAAGFIESAPVYVAGVAGTTEANGLWFIHLVDTTHVELLGSTFVHTYSGSGATMKMSALKIRSLHGGLISGGGRLTTTITTDTTNCALISTNGFDYSKVSSINLGVAAGCTAFDLNWMLSDPISGGGALQSNTFFNMNFGGPFTTSPTVPSGKYGLAIGAGGVMGSENLVLNCYFQGFDAGIITLNGNALEQTIISGNVAFCNTAIYASQGSITTIEDLSTQQNILVMNFQFEAGDSIAIFGSRDEDSTNYMTVGPVMPVSLNSCSYKGTGHFHDGHGLLTVNSCFSNGDFNTGGAISIKSSNFTSSTYLNNAIQVTQLEVFPKRVTTQTGATYTLIGPDCGSTIQFNRATGQTVTVPRTHGSGTFLTEGATIDVVQIGAGQTTFVAAGSAVVQSSNGLKLRAQWSKATLTVIAPDTWLLTGDTAP